MIFLFAVAAIDFLKGFLLDVEDSFFKFSDYSTEEDAYAAAAAWVDVDNQRWDWDIGQTLNITFRIIEKIHEAVQYEFIREWASQGNFDIVIPGCGLTIEIIKDFVLQDLPSWLTDFDSEFCLRPLKSIINDEGTMEPGYYVMRKRLEPYFQIPGTDSLLYTIDGVKGLGSSFDPPKYLNDRDLSTTLDHVFLFAYWTNIVYHILKSETAKRWVDSMVNTVSAYRRFAQLRKIDDSISNIVNYVDEVEPGLLEISTKLAKIDRSIGLRLALK